MNMVKRTIHFIAALLIGISPLAAQDNAVDVAVFSLNDFHGAFVQNTAQGIPGAPSVLQTLDSLKAVYPHHLTVSAGDNFGGSYFYTATQGQLLPVFFDAAGIRLSALGNHEFDDGQDALAAKWKDDPLRPEAWDLDYICANVLDPAGRIPSYAQPYAVEEVAVSPTKKVRVALVGLLASSAKEQISARRIEGMAFRGDYTRVLDSLRVLPDFKRVEESEIRVLLMHIGARMVDGQPRWDDKNPEELAQITGPLYQAFLVGHSHDPVCGRINDDRKPITQGWWHGNFISVMKFRVDTVRMQVVGAEPEIVPVPLRRREALSPRALHLQMQIDSLLQATKTKGGVSIGTRLTRAAADMPHDRSDKRRISDVGTLVCESYAEAYREAAPGRLPVVGVSHFGSVRAGFVKGDITVLDVGEVLPFQNAMNAFRVDGRLFRELVEFGYHNERYGWMQASNLRAVRDKRGHVKRIYYVAPDGKRMRIKNSTELVIVADEFMSNGGDGYDPRFFPKDRKLGVRLPAATDCLIRYLRAREEIGR